MYQSYVFFRTDLSYIEMLESYVLGNGGQKLKHMMTSYADKGIIARFVTKNEKEFQKHLFRLNAGADYINETRVLFAGFSAG